jgi:hypothetical protein
MLKKLSFRISLNSALRELGIDPIILNAQLRRDVVDMSTAQGLEAKEAAIGVYAVLVDQLNAVDRMAAKEIIRQWRLLPEVREANYQLAIHGKFFSPRVPEDS